MNKELALIAILQGYYVTLDNRTLYSYSDGLFCVTDSSKGNAKTFDADSMPKSDDYKFVTITKESVLDPYSG